MAKLLSWTDAERAREVEQVRARIRGDLGFRGAAPGARPGRHA
jgi:hypothetical protein